VNSPYPARVRVLALVLLVMCGSGGSWRARADDARPAGTLWVVAPHPDDEVLMATEALARAVRTGASYEVAIVTNGDFGCSRNGWLRQQESIAALAAIGVTEDHVHFLGYPDGWLAQLGKAPLPPVERAGRDGSCGTGSTTYGARGHEHGDVHTGRTGLPAPYTSTALVDDLRALFAAAPPREIHLPHAIDDHPDHAMTYAFVRRALAQTQTSALLVRHVVHAGPCWPAVDAEGTCVEPTAALTRTPLPPLPPPLKAVLPNHITPADPLLRTAAIAHHISQLDGPLQTSWLSSFARTTEVAWLEPIVNGEPTRTPLADHRYMLRQHPGRIDVVRVDNGHEHVLRAWSTSTPATALTLRVTRETTAVVLEVHGPDGFIVGALDPDRAATPAPTASP
jgi:LmbE family N-acetylglucosaminyl deacetylase